MLDDTLPRLRHDPARRRAAGGPQPHASPTSSPSRGSSTSSASASSRAAGRARSRRTPSSSRRAAHRAATCSTRSSPRSARPAGPACRRPTTRRSRALRDSRRAGRDAWSPSPTTGTSSCALRTTLEENLAMIRDTVAHLRRRGPAGLPRRRALLRRLPRPTATTRSRCCARPREAGADVVALCDTNGGMLPDRGRRRRRRRRCAAPAPGSASTATTTPAARSPTPSPRSTPAPPTCRAPPTGTASGPATPTCSRVVANLELKHGPPVAARRRAAPR